MHVDRTSATVVVVAPYFLQQLGAREHAAGVLDQVLEEFELLVCQIDGASMQGGGIAVGVHNEVAGANLAIFHRGGGFGGRTGCCGCGSVAALGDQSQSALDFGRGSGGDHHIRNAPLGVDHGEAAFGQHQHDWRGQAGSVDEAAQGFGGRQIIACIQKQNGVLRHLHQAGCIHRQYADAMRKQGE